MKPNAADVVAYLSNTGAPTNWSTPVIEAALEAEDAAQGKVCRRPALAADWPADLAEALKRRVARNLAMRKAPLGIAASSAEIEGTRIGGRDPEIHRLEAPYRKGALKIG